MVDVLFVETFIAKRNQKDAKLTDWSHVSLNHVSSIGISFDMWNWLQLNTTIESVDEFDFTPFESRFSKYWHLTCI